MKLDWQKLPYAKGEQTTYNGQKIAIIERRRGEVRAYVGNTRLPDSANKKEAMKKIMEAIDEQRKLF